LEAAGLPAPTPLLVCEDAEGIVYVLMEYLVDAVTLGAFMINAARDELRACMEDLASLVTGLHRAGARQMDQHIDNWALAGGSLYVLDAGTYRLEKAALAVTEQVADLAAICSTLPPQAEKFFRKSIADRDRDATGASGKAKATFEADLSTAVAQVQQARVCRYYKKTQRTCTEFGQRSEGAWRGMFGQGGDAELVAAFFDNPDALIASGERVKSGNTCTVQRFRFGQREYVLKRYNQKPWGTRLRRALVASRARRSWSNSWVLDMSFIPTARSVAFAEERGFPLRRCYLLMEAVDAVLLPDYAAQHRNDEARVTALVEDVGRIWDQMARIAAAHGDLKATNWMVDASGVVSLIDLDSFRFALSESAFKRGREKDRKRFLENWKADPELAARFLQRLTLRTQP
jgi:tRNA A-37 threonylcarbamoyl transferase component Bud32